MAKYVNCLIIYSILQKVQPFCQEVTIYQFAGYNIIQLCLTLIICFALSYWCLHAQAFTESLFFSEMWTSRVDVFLTGLHDLMLYSITRITYAMHSNSIFTCIMKMVLNLMILLIFNMFMFMLFFTSNFPFFPFLKLIIYIVLHALLRIHRTFPCNLYLSACIMFFFYAFKWCCRYWKTGWNMFFYFCCRWIFRIIFTSLNFFY